MISLVLMAALAAEPTVDAVEREIAAVDRANDEAWCLIDDRGAFDLKRATFREAMQRELDFDAIARTPLNAKTVASRDYDGFRVEKTLFETLPGEYVTALVFVPLSSPKPAAGYPAFLFSCGHSDSGKSQESYLATCELGARNGFVAMMIDPLGQGERSQGAGFRSAVEHTRIGAYAAALFGKTAAKYFVRDAVRALDYLESRPDVDSSRLGAVGNSGGGTLTAYLMTVEPRIRAAVPSCYISNVRSHILACGPQDAEQNFFDGPRRIGFNHVAMVLASGIPVLINAANDDFFQIDGARSTYAIVRGLADRFGYPPDYYALAQNPGRHTMSKLHRERAIAFLSRWLRGETVEIREGTPVKFAPEDSRVTPESEVSKLPGFRSVYDEMEKECARFTGNGSAGLEPGRPRPGMEGQRQTESGPISDFLRLGDEDFVPLAAGERLVMREQRTGKRSYYSNRKDDEEFAVDLYINGTSLVRRRAEELVEKAREFRRQHGTAPRLEAGGRFAVVASLAASLAPDAFCEIRIAPYPAPRDRLLRRERLSFADFPVP